MKDAHVFSESWYNSQDRLSHNEDTRKAGFGRPDDWMVVELSKFQILYQPKGVSKSQALADFAAELSPHLIKEEDFQWILHVDGFFNNRSCGTWVVLGGPGDILLEQALKFDF